MKTFQQRHQHPARYVQLQNEEELDEAVEMAESTDDGRRRKFITGKVAAHTTSRGSFLIAIVECRREKIFQFSVNKSDQYPFFEAIRVRRPRRTHSKKLTEI